MPSEQGCKRKARIIYTTEVEQTPLAAPSPVKRARSAEQIRAVNLWKNYRIGLDQFEEMLAAQDRRCAVCGIHEGEIDTRTIGGRKLPDGSMATAATMQVDHCHTAGTLRGLLCPPCNRALGLFRDDPALLDRAAAYLRHWATQTENPFRRRTSMPERIYRRRTKGWRKPEGAVAVDRSTKWGNPFKPGVEGVVDAEHAVMLYREFMEQRPDLVAAARTELAGMDLMCPCPTGQPCHADALLEIANGAESCNTPSTVSEERT